MMKKCLIALFVISIAASASAETGGAKVIYKGMSSSEVESAYGKPKDRQNYRWYYVLPDNQLWIYYDRNKKVEKWYELPIKPYDKNAKPKN